MMSLTVAEWHDKCVRSFSDLCGALQQPAREFTDEISLPGVASQLGRFRVWAGNIGAHQHGRRVSLDYRLRDASRLKDQVVELLKDLDETISDSKLRV